MITENTVIRMTKFIDKRYPKASQQYKDKLLDILKSKYN